jgi:GT2 family glycosyltransferase
MPAPPRIAVVVLSYNGLDDTRKCLRSLEHAMRPFVVPLLVDNGSTDGTGVAVAREFPWCRIVRVETNRGPIVGNNAGIRAALDAGVEWITLLNNDTTVDPGLFDQLSTAVQAHPGYDALGPIIYFMGDPTVVMTDGCMFNMPDDRGFFVRQPVPLTREHPPAITETDIVNGCCLMVRATVFSKIGTFDERLFMYHDELDLCLRIGDVGGKLGIIDHPLVWHKGSATSIGTGKRSIRYFDARNLWHVLRKHGFATRHGRSRLRTAAAYFRYMYYWYDAECAAGNDTAAAAVLDGMHDGLAGSFGPYTARRRPMTPVLGWIFRLGRRASGQPETKARAR